MTQASKLDPILNAAPVVPVLIIEDAASAVPLASALVQGGLPAIEITLRTDAAFAAIERVAGEVEGAIAGVGTILNAKQFERAEAVGARFAVSPGCTPELISAAEDRAIPLLPGAASASEAMNLLEHGFERQKFFPAEAAGGAPFLKSLASPLPMIRFCPTGGVTPTNALEYLALPNVVCVGGSWVVPVDAVSAMDWERIAALASAASSLGGPS